MYLCTTIKDLPRSIAGNIIAFDIETTGLIAHKDKVLIVALSDGTSTYVVDCTKGIDVTRVFRWVKYLSQGKVLVGHNLTFDLKFALHHGVRFDGHALHDTMLAEQLCTAGLLVPQGFSLKALVQNYINVTMDKTIRDDFIGNDTIDLEEHHFQYAADDVTLLFPIVHEQQKIIRHEALEDAFALEMRTLPVTVAMEYSGIALDYQKLTDLIPIFENVVQRSHQALQDLFITHDAVRSLLIDKDGYSAVNLNSKPTKRKDGSINLGQTYSAFEKLGITPVDKRGNPTLSAKYVMQWDMKNARDVAYDYAEALALDDVDMVEAITSFEGLHHPVLRAYAYYIAADKILQSYVKGTAERYDPSTGRYYGWFKQLGARSTGRYSSNTQQIPKNEKLQRLSIPHSIRHCFIAPPGKKLLISDFSGIEMVILADVSGDEVLGRLIVDSAAGNDDIHLYVVRHAFTDIYPDAQYATVDKKKQYPYTLLRNAAKPTSYGIAYGITGMALSDTITKELASMGITCTVAQAQTILDNWKERAFKKAGTWLTNAGLDALQCGFAATRLGRKRFFDLEYARRYEWRQHAIQREASNSPIQGACADLMKLAMCYLYERIGSMVGHDAAKIVLTVHDELLVEVDDLHVEQVSGMMKASMEDAAQALLPVMGQYVKVDVAVSQQYDK